MSPEKLRKLKSAIKTQRKIPNWVESKEILEQLNDTAMRRIILAAIEEVEFGHIKNLIEFPLAGKNGEDDGLRR